MSLPYLTTAGLGFGSRVVTFSTGNSNGVAFIAEEYSPTEPTAQTTRTTELGAPNGWIGFEERRTANWKLQVATNSTNYFDRGDECIVTRKTTGTNTINVTMVVVEMGLPERPRDFWSIDVQLLEKK
jgi:hypothetical protein